MHERLARHVENEIIDVLRWEKKLREVRAITEDPILWVSKFIGNLSPLLLLSAIQVIVSKKMLKIKRSKR